MPLPPVTIVTPSYNQARFLEETIQSVLAQQYPGLEYAVVDGGSTDGSVEIIRRYEDRLAWWTSGPDGGQAAALNRAFGRAGGEILGWLNSDDVLLPGALAAAAGAFERDSDVLLVYGDDILVDAASREVGLLAAREFDAVSMIRSWQNHVPQPGSLFRRRALELAGPFDEGSQYYFDFQFVLGIALAGGRARRLERPLAMYRLHGESKSMSAPRVKAEDHLRLHERVFGRGDLPPEVRAVEREAMALSHLTAGEYFYAALDVRRARREILRALRLERRRRAFGLLLRTLLPRPVARVLRAFRAR